MDENIVAPKVPNVEDLCTDTILSEYNLKLLTCATKFQQIREETNDSKYDADLAQIKKYRDYLAALLKRRENKNFIKCDIDKLQRISKHIMVYGIRHANRNRVSGHTKRSADDLADVLDSFKININTDDDLLDAVDALSLKKQRVQVREDGDGVCMDEEAKQEGGKKKAKSGKKKYTKTNEKVLYKKRERSVYLGVRGGKYVMVKGEFVALK